MKLKAFWLAIVACYSWQVSLYAAGSKGSVSTAGQLSVTAVASTQKKKFNKESGKLLLTMGSISFDAFLYDMANRVKYKACIDLTADMSTVKQQNPALNSAYLSVSGKYGDLQLGNTFSAASQIMIDGTQLLGGDGGFSGVSLFSAYNPSSYATIMTGCYYDPGYATQMTYMSPSFRGFQFGISYIPNSLHLGLLPENSSFNSLSYQLNTYPENFGTKRDAIKNKDLMAWGSGGFTRDAIAGGIRYDYGVPHHINFSISLFGWHGKAYPEKKITEPLKIKPLNTIGTGFTFGYKHIKFGAGYINQLKSCLPSERSDMTKEELNSIPKDEWKDIVEKGDVGTRDHLIEQAGFGKGADAGQIYTAVLSYLPGIKSKISVGGMYAPRKMAQGERTKTLAGSLSFDYRVTQGVNLYVGCTYMKTTTCRRAILISMSEAKSAPAFWDNHIVFISTGVKMSF